MGGNHENWDYLARILNERLDEMGYDNWRALRNGGMRASYQTFLLSGRARLKPRFVKPVAQALDLDETWLFCIALEGMQQPDDLPYISEFLWRMYASLEAAKLRDEVQPQKDEPHEERKKTKKGKKGRKDKKRKKKAD